LPRSCGRSSIFRHRNGVYPLAAQFNTRYSGQSQGYWLSVGGADPTYSLVITMAPRAILPWMRDGHPGRMPYPYDPVTVGDFARARPMAALGSSSLNDRRQSAVATAGLVAVPDRVRRIGVSSPPYLMALGRWAVSDCASSPPVHSAWPAMMTRPQSERRYFWITPRAHGG